MYLEKQLVLFKGKLSSKEDRGQLVNAGFVHVTGISVYDQQDKFNYIIGEKITDDQTGKWDYNNGKVVIITTGGEVWLRAAAGNYEKARDLFRNLCPNGKGAFVPLSNGERISYNDILTRVADPYAGLGVKI